MIKQYYFDCSEGMIDLSRKACKEFFIICVLYGGGIDGWMKNNSIPPYPDPPILGQFKDDMEGIIKYCSNVYPELFAEFESNNEVKNADNSIVSWFCQEEERKVLEVIYSSLKKHKIIKAKSSVVFIHDGLQIPIECGTNGIEMVIKQLEVDIHKLTGFNIKLEVKAFDNAFGNDLLSFEPTKDLNDSKCEDTYETFKIEFEKTHFKCIDLACFYKENYDHEGVFTNLISFSENSLKVAYKHLNYEVATKKSTRTCYYIDDWLNDQNIRRYNKFDCFPPPLICPHNVYNLWKPFRVEVLKCFEKDENGRCIISNDEKEELMVGLEMIVKHILIICGNHEITHTHLMKWIGHALKFPAEKSIMPTIIGVEGSGKTKLFDFIELLVGRSKYLKTTKPDRDIWGNFNGLMANAYFVYLDELSLKQTQEAEGVIKDLITNKTIVINNKGDKTYTISSFHKFGASTNNESPIKTVKGDRRNFIFEASGEKKGDYAYFEELSNYMENPKIQLLFYEYVTNLPGINNFAQTDIPITNYQSILQESNRSEIDLFMEHYVNQNQDKDETVILSKELFDLYVAWKEANQYEFNVNLVKFSRNLMLLKVPDDSIISAVKDKTLHTKKGNQIRFNIIKLKKHFGIGSLIELKSKKPVKEDKDPEVQQKTKEEKKKEMEERRKIAMERYEELADIENQTAEERTEMMQLEVRLKL